MRRAGYVRAAEAEAELARRNAARVASSKAALAAPRGSPASGSVPPGDEGAIGEVFSPGAVAEGAPKAHLRRFSYKLLAEPVELQLTGCGEPAELQLTW